MNSPAYRRHVANVFAIIGSIAGTLGLVGWLFIRIGPHGYINGCFALPLCSVGYTLAGVILLVTYRSRNKLLIAGGAVLLAFAVWLAAPLVMVVVDLLLHRNG